MAHFDGDPIQTGKTIQVELVPNGLLCLSPREEGVPDVEERVQSFITENIRNMYSKTEEIIQENLRRSQRIAQLNKDLFRKLTGK